MKANHQDDIFGYLASSRDPDCEYRLVTEARSIPFINGLVQGYSSLRPLERQRIVSYITRRLTTFPFSGNALMVVLNDTATQASSEQHCSLLLEQHFIILHYVLDGMNSTGNGNGGLGTQLDGRLRRRYTPGGKIAFGWKGHKGKQISS